MTEESMDVYTNSVAVVLLHLMLVQQRNGIKKPVSLLSRDMVVLVVHNLSFGIWADFTMPYQNR